MVMGRRSPKNLAKVHESKRGKEEVNGPRNEVMKWAGIAEMLAYEA